MSALRPYRLERELDSAFYHWLAWLPSWRPAFSKHKTMICDRCPRYIDALGLDELAHDPLHGLFGGIDSLIASQFDREVDALFPRLRASGEWDVSIEDGVVTLRTAQGETLDSVLERDEAMGFTVERPLTTVTPEAASRARLVLVRAYWSLFEVAIARLGMQRSLVLRAVDAHIEPKIRILADDLVSQLCDPV